MVAVYSADCGVNARKQDEKKGLSARSGGCGKQVPVAASRLPLVDLPAP